MNHRLRLLWSLVALVVALPTGTAAHFKLLEPASWIKEDERLGDPQKLGPCGIDPKDASKLATGAVTKVTGGSRLHLRIQETVYHSGHYRVALAVNSRSELPPDPLTFEKYTDRGLYSVWGVIQSPPQIPVIADGLFPHYPKPGEPASSRPTTPMAPWETDVQLPNISCAKCTLQVIQFMADHVYNQPGGYSYHHCADLQITADASKPLDKGWPAAAGTQ